MLIRYSANVNATDNDGCTTLHVAACRGRVNMVNLLIDSPLCYHTIANK